MHLIKTIRKNKTKIMVFAIIFLMISFVGGSALQQMLSKRTPDRKPFAKYADGTKITYEQLKFAQSQLEVLRALGANRILLSNQSLPALLVGNVLFNESSISSRMYSQFKMSAMRGRMPIDFELVDSYFENLDGRNGLYWILLNYEADQAGCAVSREQAIALFKNYAPALSQGGDASTMVAAISKNYQIEQEVVMDIFARLLSVVSYTELMASNSNVTLPEIEAEIGFQKEKVSANFVKFAASNYLDQVADIDEAKLQQQFDGFKNSTAGSYTEENPYGFGYMLPDSVQIEYLIIRLDDIAATIAVPTPEETEEYYARNKSKFTEEIPADPANPESEKTTRMKTYVEVASQIEKDLITQKRDIKAQKMLNEAKTLTEDALLDKNLEELTGDQLKELAGDYAATAQKLNKDWGIDVFEGKTGLLSMEQLTSDRQLGMLMLERANRTPVGFTQLAFAVEGLDALKLSKLDGKAPKMFENIGPLKGMYSNTIALVRIVDAKKAQAPEDINTSYAITAAKLTKDEIQPKIYTVRDDVVEDCKILEAMTLAKNAADEFVASAGDDWDKKIEELNKDSKTKLSVSKYTDRPRISEGALNTIKIQSSLMPGRSGYINYTISNKLLIESIYGLADAQLPATIEFAPDRSAYAVKDVSITEATTAEYDELKTTVAFQKESAGSLVSAFVQCNPKNIMARTGFELLEKKQEDEQKTEEKDQQ